MDHERRRFVAARGALNQPSPIVVSNVFVPGGHRGWHTHPGPSVMTVKTGAITV
jgi:hypothetical protein